MTPCPVRWPGLRLAREHVHDTLPGALANRIPAAEPRQHIHAKADLAASTRREQRADARVQGALEVAAAEEVTKA